MTKKENLIKQLELERDRLLAQGKSPIDHNFTIQYLQTSKTSASSPDLFELLDAAMHDFDCLCADYGVTE